ncbi:MAG: glycosyltransferase family 2 protein [Anaerolineae bacterium]|nr:glycosyltransferase family 2 protein [Anaerolineae bacterium]
MSEPRITVAVLARDNEEEIAACLESAAWADERLVVLDARSTDTTAEIARERGAQVVERRFDDFAGQRNYALSLATTEWVLFLDTDERITPALAQEVRRVTTEGDRVGWWVPRRNLIWGREIRHGGWWPDHQLRLLRIGKARYDPERPVHEVVLLDGPEGYLEEPLIHYNYATVREFTRKQRQYVEYEARILHDRGVHPRLWTYLTQPLREFRRRYLSLQGFKDGFHGLLLCLLVAYYYGFVVTRELGRLWREDGR